jgi:hypothetical protein
MAIELAWGWVRLPPESPLPPWYPTRLGQGSARLRKMGMVALARKLLLALGRFLRTGARPAGAVRKVEGASETIPANTRVLRRGIRGFGLVWTTRWGARVHSVNRGGGGVVPPRAAQAPRAQAGSGA